MLTQTVFIAIIILILISDRNCSEENSIFRISDGR